MKSQNANSQKVVKKTINNLSLISNRSSMIRIKIARKHTDV